MSKEKTEEKNRIKIDQLYYIDTDPYQYLLQRKTTVQSGKNKGEIAYSTISYHGNLTSLFDKYLDIRVKDGIKSIETVQELIELIKETKEEVKEILKGIEK